MALPIKRFSTLINETSGSFVISQSMAASFYARKVEPVKPDRTFYFNLKLKTDTSTNPIYTTVVESGSFVPGTNWTKFNFTTEVPDPPDHATAWTTASIVIDGEYIFSDAANIPDISDYYFDDFRITADKPFTEVSQDGILIFNSEDNFIKMDASGLQISGGYFNPAKIEAISIRCKTDLIVDNILDVRNKIRFGLSSQGIIEGNLSEASGETGQPISLLGGSGSDGKFEGSVKGPTNNNYMGLGGPGGTGADLMLCAGAAGHGGPGGPDPSGTGTETAGEGGLGGDTHICAGSGGAGNDDQNSLGGGNVDGHSDGGDGGKVYIYGGYKGRKTATAGGSIYDGKEGDVILAYTGASTRGNVGIGDPTPAYPLEVVGYNAINNITIHAQRDIAAYSDIRAKTDIVTIQDPLNKVLNIRGITYRNKDENGLGIGNKMMGVIAQEVEPYVPEVVGTRDDPGHKLHGHKSVKYGNITALLIEAIKEQQEQIEELKQQVKEIKDAK